MRTEEQEVVQDRGTNHDQEESQRMAAQAVEDPGARTEEREKGSDERSGQTPTYGMQKIGYSYEAVLKCLLATTTSLDQQWRIME